MIERKVTEEFTVRLETAEGVASVYLGTSPRVKFAVGQMSTVPAINAAIASMRDELRPCGEVEAMYRGRRVRFEVSGIEIVAGPERFDVRYRTHDHDSNEKAALRLAAFAWYDRTRGVGENQWREPETKQVVTFSDATQDGLSYRWAHWRTPERFVLADPKGRDGLFVAAACAWHAKNRPILDNELPRSDGKRDVMGECTEDGIWVRNPDDEPYLALLIDFFSDRRSRALAYHRAKYVCKPDERREEPSGKIVKLAKGEVIADDGSVLKLDRCFRGYGAMSSNGYGIDLRTGSAYFPRQSLSGPQLQRAREWFHDEYKLAADECWDSAFGGLLARKMLDCEFRTNEAVRKIVECLSGGRFMTEDSPRDVWTIADHPGDDEFFADPSQQARAQAYWDANRPGDKVCPLPAWDQSDGVEGMLCQLCGKDMSKMLGGVDPPKPACMPSDAARQVVTDGLGRRVWAWVVGQRVNVEHPRNGHAVMSRHSGDCWAGRFGYDTPELYAQCMSLLDDAEAAEKARVEAEKLKAEVDATRGDYDVALTRAAELAAKVGLR